MATEIEFCLLGPLVVRSGGVMVPVPQGKLRAVLAALLLSPGRVVSLDELAETLWGPRPPQTARVTIQNYVMRLRKVLEDPGGSLISTRPPGYMISMKAGELDVTRFEALLRDARAAVRDSSWDTAAASARAALSLWRGEPLSDVESPLLAEREIPRLAELRLQALETRIDADLQLGSHTEVISELRHLTGAHPLREYLHGQLLLALYRDGRQAEALASYQHARRVLVEELGIEPGAALQALHQRMLIADPALACPEPAPPVAARDRPAVPRELPAGVRHFTGRADELAELTKLQDVPAERAAGPVVISAIGGTAGVGKTALAVHWAHQAADRFPDGQFYVNLRGYDPGQPMTAADALAGFLRALGVEGQDIPAGEAERAARYRSLLAGRRMLVLLDNARSVQQVRPLLPGTPTCAVMVTSRDALTGLMARDGATRLDLDLLPQAEAVGLLRALIGTRVDADPAASATLAAQCCRLPLALRVAAQLAADRPAAPLAELAAELADQQRLLDLLDAGGDPRTAVRAVFSWSYRHLSADAARTFRLAGLHPGSGFDSYAVAALMDATVDNAAGSLDLLACAHLIQPAGPARYGMHDLLRAYAGELLDSQDGREERRAALTRLFDYYLYAAASAVDTVFPAEQHRRPRIPRPATPVRPSAAPAAAQSWLDAELPNLIAAARMTVDGWPGYTTRLAVTLGRYLDNGGYYPEAMIIHSCARRAGRQAGDQAGEAAALLSIGGFEARQGRYQQAAGHLRQSLALYRKTGDRPGEARALGNLGAVGFWQGRYRQAAGHYQQALVLFEQTGDRVGAAVALSNLGHLETRQGRYQQATSHLQQAVAICRETGDRTAEAQALGNLGNVEYRQGRYQQAAGHHQHALALFRELGDRTGEAHTLADIADVELRQGRHRQAAGHQQQAIALFRESGNRAGEADALNGLAEVSFARGQLGHARAHHAAALRLASQIGHKVQQARAHDGLGQACHAAGDLDAAGRHWREALARYAELGAPEADQVRARLAAVPGQAGPASDQA